MWQPTVSYGELYHHGILGQKWGIRRYQNPDGSLTSAGRKRYGANTVEEIKSKKGIQRRLNDLDQAQAFNKRAYSEARSKNIQLENKKEKMMESRRPNQKKLRKMNNETIKTASEMRKAESYLKKGDKEKEALIKAAEIMGYDVKSKEVNRSVVRGKDVMKHVGLDVLSKTLSVVTGSPFTLYTLPANRAPGTKYKVKDSKALEAKKAAEFASSHKDPKGTYSKENLSKKSKAITDAQLKGMSKKNIVERAVKNDSYPIGFLEAIQNKKMLSSGNKKELKKAYGEYLDDPEKFWKTGRHKWKDE